MNKSAQLLPLIIGTIFLTIGAVYYSQNTTEPTATDNNIPTFINGVLVDADRDGMAISAIIGPGIEIIKTKTGTTVIETKSYGDALNIYGKSGYRLQFSNCSGTPGTFTIKLGTKFMIDNRDAKSHLISIGTKKYNLSAYDFAIVTIQKIGDINITCDGGGAAHVLVQK
ncbi:MAG: hypothetical protein Q7S24_00930 [bacterium]|nr:hypothetical protein [bacterium]